MMRLHLIFVRFLSWLGISKGVYYIGRTDTLPPPLSEEEEEALLANLDEDRRYRGILVERNLRLVVYIAKKFENTGIGMDDLISIGTIGLIKAVNTFSYEKSRALSSYAAKCIENAILSQMRLWFRINPPRAKKNTNGVFWHRFPRIFTSFAPLRTAM